MKSIINIICFSRGAKTNIIIKGFFDLVYYPDKDQLQYFDLNFNATFTSNIRTGTSTNGPITVANAA